MPLRMKLPPESDSDNANDHYDWEAPCTSDIKKVVITPHKKCKVIRSLKLFSKMRSRFTLPTNKTS